MRKRSLKVSLALGGAFALCFQAQAFNVYLEAATPVRPGPSMRSGAALARLEKGSYPLGKCRYNDHSELWCLLHYAPQKKGWAPALKLDPQLMSNQPLRFKTLPAELILERGYWRLKHKKLDAAQFKELLMGQELAYVRLNWERLRQRYNFLDISRRAGVSISQVEFDQIGVQMRALEEHYQRLSSQYVKK